MAQNPVFTITMRSGRVMKGELYPETAPQSVGNFVALANSGFYDGLIFHRVIPGFMIQGGDPKGMGFGGPGYCIKGEFAANGVPNPVKHTYGVLSMARSMAPDSAGSQFFIMTSDSPHLDGQYAAFGKVLEGMDVAEDIVNTPRDRSDKPLEEYHGKAEVYGDGGGQALYAGIVRRTGVCTPGCGVCGPAAAGNRGGDEPALRADGGAGLL